MNLDHMLAQLRGTLPTDVLKPESLGQKRPTCSQRRCKKTSVDNQGQRRVREIVPPLICLSQTSQDLASGGRKALVGTRRLQEMRLSEKVGKGDFLCQRCRDERDVERAQKRQDARDAAAIDEFAAQPERVHKASNLDCGISPWNSGSAPEPSAAYWSPLPDPAPKQSETWRWSLMNGRPHHRY